MDSINSVHAAFDKRRVRFSDWIVHYSVIFSLLFVGLSVSSYYIVKHQYEKQLSHVNDMHEIVYSVNDMTQRWREVLAGEDEYELADLLQLEQSIHARLQERVGAPVQLPDTLSVSDQYTLREHARLALNRLSQLKQVATQQFSALEELRMGKGYLMPLVGLGWVLLFAYLIWGWRRVLQDRRVALRFYHSQIDLRKSDERYPPMPIVRNDEFGEFARYLDSVLNAIAHDITLHNTARKLYQAAFSVSLSCKALVNKQHEILAVSEGLSELWILESAAIADVLGVDEHLSDLEGEVVSDTLVTAQSSLRQRIGTRLYELRCQHIAEDKGGGYLIELVPLEAHSELKALEAALALMSGDVWDAPVRILDEASPYLSFSRKLEGVRRQVYAFIQSMNQRLEDLDKGYPKVTKLQQLSDQVIARLDSDEENFALQTDHCETLISEVDVSKQDFLYVREQIELRFELYETYLEQLFEHQMAQVSWVARVSEGLMDAKKAVFGLLSLVTGEKQNASVIEHSVIDLTHDIDAVLSEIAESKPAYEGLGLEHIKSSESDLMMRLNDVQMKLDKLTELAQIGSEAPHK